MANKSTKVPAVEAECRTAEEWRIRKQVPGAYAAGMMQMKGWKKDKMVREEEFEAALQEFLSAASDGRTK